MTAADLTAPAPPPLDSGLEDKGVIVTGAARGVGAATALLFAANGARVCAVDVNAQGLRELAAALPDTDRHLTMELDLREVQRYRELIDHARTHLGGIHAVAHAAGLLLRQPLEEVTEADWDIQVDVNLKSAFFLSRAAAAVMVDQAEGGRIVNFTTGSWVIGPHHGSHAYVAAKTGIVGLTRGLARAYGPHGILVNAIAPGQVDTPLQREGLPPDKLAEAVAACPLGRMGDPEEIANVVMFLCSRHASFITGATLNVSGGLIMY